MHIAINNPHRRHQPNKSRVFAYWSWVFGPIPRLTHIHLLHPGIVYQWSLVSVFLKTICMAGKTTASKCQHICQMFLANTSQKCLLSVIKQIAWLKKYYTDKIQYRIKQLIHASIYAVTQNSIITGNNFLLYTEINWDVYIILWCNLCKILKI